MRSARHLNKDHLCLDLLTADWSSVYEARSPSGKYDAWLKVWDSVINQHMPLTQIKVHNPPCPWVRHDDEALRQLMRDRDSARTEDRNPYSSTWQAYRGLRNAVKGRLATARQHTSEKPSRAPKSLTGNIFASISCLPQSQSRSRAPPNRLTARGRTA